MVQIAGAGKAEGGWYQCTAYNSAGSCATRARVMVDVPPDLPVQKEPVKLNIPYPPRIIEPEYDKSKIKIHCQIVILYEKKL